MLLRKKKKGKTAIERYENFHIQVKYDCNKSIKTIFIEMPEPLDESFLEFFKPFGDIIPSAAGIYEIHREFYFTLRIPMGRKSIHVNFPEMPEPDAKNMLINQVILALDNAPPQDLKNKCPENAIYTEEGKFRIDRTKCTFCLDCVVKSLPVCT